MISDRLVLYSLFTRRDWSCSLFRLRFYYLACLKFNAELFLFVIFSTFSFVLVQLSFIYRLSSWSLRNHHFTLLLFSICKKFKAIRDKYFDLLNLLSILNRSWMNIIINLVIELFESKKFNAILMMWNRLTKMHHYISCTATEKDINAAKIVRLLINHVWKLHELSSTIISNRDSQFISLIWKFVCEILRIDVKLFTAFHLETNDQSEIVN